METLMLILAGLLVLGTPLALLICVIILFTRLKAVRRRQDTLEDDLRSLREPAGASPRATPPPLPAMPVEEPETLQPAPSMDPAQKAERILGALRGRDREEGEAPAAGATEGAPAPMAPLDEPLGADEAEAPALVLEDAAAGAAPLDALPEGAAARKPLSFELRLGQNWFNRAGIGVLVIGVVLLFAYYVPSMGGWGKIIASGICGAAMIAGGIILEKREHYRTVALGLIAGGWAVLYSLAYALHNIPALRKIESDFWGLALLFAVAAGMIQHSLSYRSPRVTGAAFLFAVIGITAAPPTTWVPFAIGVLGLAQVIVSRSGLHGGLRISALLVTYAAQLIWVLRAGGTAAGEWTEVLPWVQWGLVAQALVFALSVPRGGGEAAVAGEEGPGPAGDPIGARVRAAFPSLLNLGAALMVILALEESLVHPGPWHFPLALAGAGIVEALLRGVGRWRALEWAPAFAGALLLGLLAALLGLSAGWTQVIFLGAGVGLGLLGRRARLPSLAALGAAILLFALLWILALSMDAGVPVEIPVGPLRPRWTLLLAAAALHAFHGMARGEGKGVISRLAWAGALAGTAVMFLWTFLEGPGEWRPVMLAGFALLHHAQAIYFRDARISFLGHAVALAAGAVAGLAHWEEARRALPPLAELPLTGRLAGIPAPLLWTFLPAAVLYFFWWAPAPLLQGARGPGEIALGARIDSRLRAIAASAGWLLIVVLLYTICVASFTSPALSMLALLLVLVAAPRLREPLFAAHGLATALIAGAHLFLVNFSLDERVILGVSLRFLTVLPVLLALIHLRREVGGAPEKPIEIGGRDLVPVWREISGYLTMAVIAALIRFEFPRPLVAALWAAVGLAALWLGMARRDRSIGLAGHLLLLAGGTRGISVNPSLEGSHFGVPLRYLASLPVAVPLLAAGELLRRRPVEGAGPVVAHLARIARTSYPFLFTFFAGAYIYDSVEGAYLTLAWSLEGGAFLALGFFLTNRPLRLSSLGLLIFCLAKALLYDVRGLDPAYRIFSFLALGAVMIGVSFVYARFKHRMGESL